MLKQVQFDNRNLHERVYIYLRDKIVLNQLPPGSRINYEELVEELGVSKTPLRDAVNRLQQEGLIEVKPRSGTFVSIPKVRDIVEIYDVRKALESQAIQLASPRIPKKVLESLLNEAGHAEAEIKKGNAETFFQADRQLHQTIIQFSENQRLISFMNTLELQIKWFGIIIAKDSDRPLQANDMHKRILTALYNEKVDEAKKLMEEHIEEIKLYTVADYS
ncbi:GntR family transcriptional regulator [Aneurinibacillus sp. Ricciae_BoGa-3]|uniref:GntR family transcriptional regulator n=1 Tax=Aneurinibacillus sp. Ricciae_BoGa-3 TaxID=3022697 RepID=UPI002340F5C7|nr:GntR family transcriptional regulator [Aneurinibacillus sp. Ricciae_BoGa-3]WCK56280.1 GntR family transcriptional regulator [Aneurinibacillus sp. Ricciae_BoGa-3]